MRQDTCAGIRVVSLAVYVPVPVAAQRFTSLGASVTAVEPPSGDPMTEWAPRWYEQLRAGQTVQRLDLKDAAQRATFDGLLDQADLLLTAMRPPALARLGLAWDALHARFPRLSHISLVGWESPDDDRPAHDLTFQAAGGLMAPPAMPNTLLADLAGAERIVSEGLALLIARERGHGAGFARVSLEGSMAPFTEPLRHGLTSPGTLLGGGFRGYRAYRAREGWIAVATLEPHFFATLVAALDLGADAATSELEAAFATHTPQHWEGWARERGLPIVAVR